MVNIRKAFWILFVLLIFVSATLLYFITQPRGELERYPPEIAKVVDYWCADIKDEYYRAICIRTIKEDAGCAKALTDKGYCIAATFSRTAFEVLRPVCKKYENPTTAHICLGKAIAFVDLEAAIKHCSLLKDEGWKYFCYADVTSKVDLEGGEKLCADIPEPNLFHFCYALMASKKNNFEGDMTGINDHCSKIDFDKFPGFKNFCKIYGYV